MARMLQCPYCDNFLARPVDIKFRNMEFTGGICRCGTVYLFDRSGRNLGEVYLDALTFLCRGDIERALSLGHEDYEDVDFEYDYQSNRLDARSRSGKSGRVIFMRLRDRGDDQNISKER